MASRDVPISEPGPRPGYRLEHDSMGIVEVPMDAKWAAQTQRAVENFPISGLRAPKPLIAALGAIKAAAAVANTTLGILPSEIADAVVSAATEVAEGRWDDHFPVDIFQTGSGTSTNMNANEVIATLAGERLGRPVHPNDHVNASQSSNDVYPTAVHLAAAREIRHTLIPSLAHLADALRERSTAFATVVKAGRTHLMDATPVTLGQEFGGYTAAVERGIERLDSVMPRLAEVPLGGTAVGTGINAPPTFAALVLAALAVQLDLPLSEARDHFEAQGARDALVETSGALRTVAVSLVKVANDIRWMASGPRTGLAEIRLPDLQPGSSIMPGKVNPVLAEAVLQVCAQVVGNDAAVVFGGAAGTLELNVMVPVLARNVLESIALLASVARLFADRCVSGIEADAERCLAYAEASPAIATALNPHIGYERAAEVVKESVRSGRSVRDLVLERGWMNEADLGVALDVLVMTKGGLRT